MEREELMKWAFPRLRKFCSDRGVFLTQVDLRWGITEDQSQAGDTINICLREGTHAPALTATVTKLLTLAVRCECSGPVPALLRVYVGRALRLGAAR